MSIAEAAETFRPLLEQCSQETVTTVHRESLETPQGHHVAVLRLDNGQERRPETLGPRSILNLLDALASLRDQAEAGSVDAVMIEGTGTAFAAGVDLALVREIRESSAPQELIGQMGHAFVEAIRDLPLPTIARVNGAALGGGLELALAADYRISHPGVKNLGVPEVRLGIFPGWAGIFTLPRLLGPEQAATLIFEHPFAQGRTLTAEQAEKIGLLDELTSAPADSTAAREQTLEWIDQLLSGEVQVKRREQLDQDQPLWPPEGEGGSLQQRWEATVEKISTLIRRKTSDASQAGHLALRLFAESAVSTRAQSRQAQVEGLAELVRGEQFPAAIYAMLDLMTHRAKNPSMAPPQTEPAQIRKVGVVGAGLMATQLALVFLTRLRVPVLISDVDQQRVDRAAEAIRSELGQQAEKGRITEEQAEHLGQLVSGTVEYADYADCDLIIEAVFEETQVKKQVFAGLEEHVRPEAILATNTSSLLVSEMVEDLQHPERVIGFHFFNPVAVMPLVEIVRTQHSTDQAVATAFHLARRLGKIAVGAQDSSGFIVNRILGVLLSEAGRAVDAGASGEQIAAAFGPLGLPMDPLTLIDLVGLPIAMHLLESLRRFQGDRFHVSESFHQLAQAGISPIAGQDGTFSPEAAEIVAPSSASPTADEEAIRTDLEDALAAEINRMVEEGVVPDRADIDLAMILGAGWPFFNGGITKYLERVGAFDRV